MGNRQRAAKLYGAYDGLTVLPEFSAPTKAPDRTLLWRLQGQRAVLHGEDNLFPASRSIALVAA